MEKQVFAVTWPVSDKDDWLPCPEERLVPKLSEEFSKYIEERRYYNLNLNLIMLSENMNCGLFLDASTGAWVGIGLFYEQDLRANPAIGNRKF